MSDKSERKFDVEMPAMMNASPLYVGDYLVCRASDVLAMRSAAQDVIDGLRAELDSFDSIFRGYWTWKDLSRFDQLLHMEANWDIERCRSHKAESELAAARHEADGLSEICGGLKKELQETQVACAKAREESETELAAALAAHIERDNAVDERDFANIDCAAKLAKAREEAIREAGLVARRAAYRGEESKGIQRAILALLEPGEKEER